MTDPTSRGAGAIAFTDLVGFTDFTAEWGDDVAVSVLDAQERAVRSALPEDARIVKELGDGLMLWFADPVSAIVVCRELRRGFGARGSAPPLGVRVGLHWGTPTRRRDDLVGHEVNLAARIVELAGPGELLVSAPLRDQIGGRAPDLEFDELGPVVMRGIPDPVRLFRVTGRAPTGPSGTPAGGSAARGEAGARVS
ncbi:MAG TPA: adenylate/guanylate cyclase domain-containing protein [Acidimicrobiia bacterium]|nr:adenylate/guanylate cyclase domain-containing protein [Acidimicrobiia bacterium]